jgi:hypothetical protein
MEQDEAELYFTIAFDWLEKLHEYKVKHPQLDLREIVLTVNDMLDDPEMAKEYLTLDC